ncbi:MAG: sensor histidine kinase [Steroidobacter sp.]
MGPGARQTVLSRLASYLEAQQQAITEQWLLAVRRDSQIDSADRLTHQQLLDHLPQLYGELCSFLRERDAAILQDGVERDARKHGHYRWRDGYRLDEVLREVEILSRVLQASTLTRFRELEPEFRGVTEITGRTLVQEFFSEVTISSAQQYTAEQQGAAARYVEQLEQANRSLQRASSQRQRLTTVIAHELRNFVQGLSYAAGVWERQPEDVKARALVQVQIRDMHDVLQRLLEHSTGIGEGQPLTIEEYDPRALSDELAATHGPSAAEKGLRFSVSNHAAPRAVIGDRLKTRQVMANLVSNAIKYTEEGEVSLRLAAVDHAQWRIEVSDTGPGMTADTGARLIAGLGSIDEALPGRGIGLGITRDLIDLLGGSIQVVSTSGEGSRVEVVLPQRPGDE